MVFADPLEICKKDEFRKNQKAVKLANMYYDSHVFIFSKRRFSDYAVLEAARAEAISLIKVDRLKYREGDTIIYKPSMVPMNQ